MVKPVSLAKLATACDQDTRKRGVYAHSKPLRLPVKPHPGPQLEALNSPADELFYGGRAGAGKSLLTLIAATKHRRSLILRRTFPQLKDLIGKARSIFRGQGSYNSQTKQWRLNGDIIINFGSLQYDKDVENYQGNEHSFIAFDEVTQFTEASYKYLQGWNRSTFVDKNGKPERCRVLATGNPPTNADGRWVIKYWGPWLDPKYPGKRAEPGELRWFITVGDKSEEVSGPDPVVVDGVTIYPRSRTFIPGTLVPELRRNNHYLSTLMGLPEFLRRALLDGEFVTDIKDEDMAVIPASWVRRAQARWEETLVLMCPMKRLGVDVARGGSDFSAFAPLHSGLDFDIFDRIQKVPGSECRDGETVALKALAMRRDDAVINIDVAAVGASPYDTIRRNTALYNNNLRPAQAVPINFSCKPTQKDKTGTLTFLNLRAQAYWALREALDPLSPRQLILPPDEELFEDLTAPRWELNNHGKIQVESKDEIKKRLGRSPDVGDSVAIAFLNEKFSLAQVLERL